MGDALIVGGGVTSPQEARLATAGLLALQSASMLDARTGVMLGPGSLALVAGTADTGPMTVTIAPHVPVTSRGVANGPYLGPVPEALTKVTIAAAPGANSRIDVVYEKQADATTSVSPDGVTAPVYGVLQGVVNAVPVKPDLSTIPGALELATVQVAAGATSTNGTGVTIANTVRQTTTRGGVLYLRVDSERTALVTAGAAYPTLEVFVAETGYHWMCVPKAGGALDWRLLSGVTPSFRAALARTDGVAAVNPTSTDLMLTGISTTGPWSTYNPGNAIGLTCSLPGRYRVTGLIVTDINATNVWEQLTTVGTRAAVLGSTNRGAGYGGAGGSFTIDAPNGLSIGFRHVNSGPAGNILGGGSVDVAWERSLV